MSSSQVNHLLDLFRENQPPDVVPDVSDEFFIRKVYEIVKEMPDTVNIQITMNNMYHN